MLPSAPGSRILSPRNHPPAPTGDSAPFRALLRPVEGFGGCLTLAEMMSAKARARSQSSPRFHRLA